MSVRAAATIGHGQVRGATLGSRDLVFEPGEVVPGKYHFDIGTAGATGWYCTRSICRWHCKPMRPVS